MGLNGSERFKVDQSYKNVCSMSNFFFNSFRTICWNINVNGKKIFKMVHIRSKWILKIPKS